MSKKNPKNNQIAIKANNVTNITEALAAFDAEVKQAMKPTPVDNSNPANDGTITVANAAVPGPHQPDTNIAEPKRRKGRARTYHLDETTRINKALCRVQHMATTTLAIDGWHAKLKATNAAQHAANSFAKYTTGKDRIIGDSIYGAALAMTVARCLDYKVTTEEAAELIQKAIEKKVAQAHCPNG